MQGAIIACCVGMKNYQLSPIGTIHSPFIAAPGTPVQPFAAKTHLGGSSIASEDLPAEPRCNAAGGIGTLEINPQWQDALFHLDGFERAWILFWCHRSNAPQTRVIPYRDTQEHGLFATRAPARPNPIGLSCVRILGINGRFVHVAEMDALNGSPLLDIKPYVPLYDTYEVQRCGWLDGHESRSLAMQADGRFEKATNPSSNR